MTQSDEARPHDCGKLTDRTQDLPNSASFQSVVLDSDEPFCRICHYPGGVGGDTLLRPCRCSGTLGDVHRTCLESWLTITRSTTCTICNYRFKTKTSMKPFINWRWSPMSCPDVTLLTFVILSYVTLLVQVTALCVLGAQYLHNRSYALACGIAGVSIGLPWQITGCVGLTVDLYFSDYWTNWREQNKRVVVVFSVQSPQRNVGTNV